MKKFLLALVLLLTVSFVGPISAQGVDDFVIHDFYGRYELKNDTPGGRLVVSESIDLNFTGMNRGILRAVPKKNQGTDMHMVVLEVRRDDKPEQFTTYDDNNGNRVIRIGNPEKYITGSHSYKITYELSRGVIMKFDGYDEWYWDINGTGWRQPFDRVRGELIVDEGIMLPEPRSACYTGIQNTPGKDCVVTTTETGFRFETTRRLGPGETLTVAAAVQPVFKAYTFQDYLRDNWYRYIGIIPGIMIVAWAYTIWRKHGRDHKGRGTIIPEYQPPTNLTPSEVGLIVDYKVHPRDITAALIDLAVRKYLVIYDDTKKYLGLFTSHNFSLELINNDFSALKAHEKGLIAAIFPSQQVAEKIEIKKLDRRSMMAHILKINNDLQKSLEGEYGLIEPTGKKWSAIFIIIASVIFIPIVFLGSTDFAPGAFIGGAIAYIGLFVIGLAMPRRSHAGVEAYEKAKGLELYMKTAEADRLKMMQSVDSPYAEPSKTYELFEKLLPYAVALGVEKSWAKQFDGLFSEAPEWYKGSSVSAFHATAFASSLTSGLSNMNQSFSAQSGSSSSGSGGGGSAGGGGGGGGGGGW